MEISIKRHSLSHIMAQAIKSIYGNNVKMAIGPDIENGFYYDFDFGNIEFKEDDLKILEKKMKQIIKQNQKFEQYDLSFDEAIKYLSSQNEDYKIEMVKELREKGNEKMSFYKNIMQNSEIVFIDMCVGPHVDNTNKIDENAFCLNKISGAYWKGDSANKMLTRIYGFAFDTREELNNHLKMIEEAKKRDHKLIGKNLDLFSFHPQSPGSCFWHPAGLKIWRELENFWRDFHNKNGYTEIQTPQMAKNDLWITSGHWDHYKDDMFNWENETNEILCLKPMDCPFGVLIYNTVQHSYKDFPIKFNEIGRIFRNEKSGELNGLFRVRNLTQDDAHIYLREDQIFEEINNLLAMVKTFYAIFNLEPKFFLSTRPDSFLGEIGTWNKAEDDLRKALNDNNINYGLKDKDGAFYGPKIDVQIKDSLGRTWQLATIQLDFQLPGRFKMEYTDENGNKKTPVMIHRAIFGTFERFIGIIIEQFAGIFPLWLAPRQVRIIPVSLAFEGYAKKIESRLKDLNIRVDNDLSEDTLNKKIRNAETLKINYILVVGEEEQKNNSVSVRNYKTKEQSNLKIEEFEKKILDEINKKSL